MRIITLAAAAAAGLALATPSHLVGPHAAAQDSMPPPALTCEDAAVPAAGTPAAMAAAHDMAGMAMGTPTAGMDHMAMDLDQMYIDMMIPHHASIVAMSQAALPRLMDERLQGIARTIIETQSDEIDELRGYREALYGDPEPMPMDEAMMAAMDEMMPGMSGSIQEMAFQMDAAAQVAAICEAHHTDLAFIELTIPHHQMAIEASETAVGEAAHEEIRAFAQRVIDDQRQEIETLTAIRYELASAATPRASGHDADANLHHGESASAGDGGSLEIRALSPELIAQIERGEGAGLALPAERNGVPGPRHVLDLGEALGLSAEQRAQVQAIHDAMRAAAIPAGRAYLAAELSLEDDFRSGALTPEELPARVAEVSRLQGELATTHLKAHLETAAVLTAEQVAAYVELRQA